MFDLNQALFYKSAFKYLNKQKKMVLNYQKPHLTQQVRRLIVFYHIKTGAVEF